MNFYFADVSFFSIQNSLRKDKIDTKATYRQDDIRCRNWIPLTFMPYSVLKITSIRLQLVAMVVLWQCKVWVYVVRQSLCCLNLQTTKQIQHILNISYSWNTVFELTNFSHTICEHPYIFSVIHVMPTKRVFIHIKPHMPYINFSLATFCSASTPSLLRESVLQTARNETHSLITYRYLTRYWPVSFIQTLKFSHSFIPLHFSSIYELQISQFSYR
jgi:hypothetical protein